MAPRKAAAVMKATKTNITADVVVRIVIALTLIAFAILARLLPHPPNFAPLAAIALLGGAVLPRRWALTVPVVAMMASDILIGLHPLIFYTWGSFAAIAFLSHYVLRKQNPLLLVTASIGASILFYVVTNFGVWAEGRLYAHTLEGLVQCYYNALPFFRNTLLGDLVFTGVLFGAFAFAYRTVSLVRTKARMSVEA